MLYLDNCLNVMKDMEDSSIDLIIADPPYRIISGGDSKHRFSPSGTLSRKKELIRKGKIFNNNNNIKFSDWIPECYRILKERTHIYIMCNDRNMQKLLSDIETSKFKIVNILVWKKNNCTPNKFYMKNCEFIVIARKGKERWINNRGTKQCLEVDNIIRNKIHPTEKPVKLIEILIKNSSNENEIVLDPFMGAGSTIIACINTNRNYIGIEIDESYYNLACERIKIIK